MEVMVAMAATSPQDFHFGSCTSTGIAAPYASAPSSPRPFGNTGEYYYCRYTSAPSSPTRSAAVYSYLARDIMDDCEEKPQLITPKFGNELDSSLGVGGQQELLFDNKGRIRPLKPLAPAPRLEMMQSSRGFWSPRGGGGSGTAETKTKQVSNERGRERGGLLSPATASSRSLSPSRETSTFVKSSGSRKWRLKDLLLFRSASEGPATGRGSKDPLRRYSLLSSSFNKRRRPGGDQDINKSGASFKSPDSNSSIKRGGGASSGPAMSAHELHYTENRAASEELKKKTPLPFHRNSLFGCLHFNPAVRSITRGFNGNSFNRGTY